MSKKSLDLKMQCTKCSKPFLVMEEDQEFYSKLAIQIPTKCPDCRVQLRMLWRNDRSFYIRKCDLSGKQMVSIYPAKTNFPVYHPSEWYGDLWDPIEYGLELDFSKPFFDQWKELLLRVPRLGIDIVNCENSDYCNYCGDDKDCYLDIAGEDNQECFYDLFTKHSKNCVDCTFVYNSEWCYESLNCYHCYEVFFSYYLENCSECWFSFDLKGCKNCIFCSNLRNQEYCIENKQVSKVQFQEHLKSLRLDCASNLRKAYGKWEREIITNAVHRDMYALNSENCIGNDIKSSKNCIHCFNISNCEDSKYLYDVLDAKNCLDLNYSLYHPECCCELISTLGMKFSACCMASHYCSESFYCDLCNNSSNLFGCIGLNRKEYCILNRQYSPEEYKRLKEKLICHMKDSGEWGQFFPQRISPFGYNETVAQEYFPMTEDTAIQDNFNWTTKVERGFYDGPVQALPDSIRDVDSEVTSQIQICSATSKPFKVIGPELKFYQRLEIPLPRESPDARHNRRLRRRNPRKLFKRKCGKCKDAIMASNNASIPYKTYCEGCYEEFLGG